MKFSEYLVTLAFVYILSSDCIELETFSYAKHENLYNSNTRILRRMKSVLVKYFWDENHLNVIVLSEDTAMIDAIVREISEKMYLPLTLNRRRYPFIVRTQYENLTQSTQTGFRYCILTDNVQSLNIIFTDSQEVVDWDIRGRFLIVIKEKIVDTKSLRNTFQMLWTKKILNVEVIIEIDCKTMQKSNLVDSCVKILTYTPFTQKSLFMNDNSPRIDLISRDITHIDSLYSDKVKNVHKYPLLITEQNSEGFQTVVSTEDGSVERTSDMLAAIIQSMNFTPVVAKNEGVNVQIGNGTLTGPVAEVASFSDICSFPKLLFCDRLKVVDFCTVYEFNTFVFISPSSRPVPQWQCFFHPFSRSVWILFCTLCFYLFICERLTQNKVFNNRNTRCISSSVLYVVAISLQMSVPPQKMCISKLTYILAALGFLVISASYECSLVSYIITPINYADIDSLEDVLNSNFKVISTPQYYASLKQNMAFRLSKLFPRFQLTHNTTAAVEDVAYRRDKMVLETIIAANLWNQIYRSSKGVPLIHVAEENLGLEYGSYIVTKGSPYLSHFNYIIDRMVEAGLRKKNYIENEIFYKQRHASNEKNSEDERTVLSLHHFQAIFYLLGLGLTFSHLSFIMEILAHKRFRRVHHTWNQED